MTAPSSPRSAVGHLATAPPEPGSGPAASPCPLDPAYVRALTARIVATTGATAATICPFTAQPLARIPQSSPDDVDAAFARARGAQRAWARTTLTRRANVLLRFHDLLLDRRDEILDLICLESGKARLHAFEEVAHLALTSRYYARTGRRELGPSRRLGIVPGLTRVEVNRVPKGVVGVISPWNYPLTMALCDGLAALMAGNAIVLKPDSQTVLTALLGVRLLEEAGLPEDVWQVVAGPGPVLGPEMISRSDVVCFTGSTATGRIVARQCGANLIGCSLELGGKNPMLVLRDADLDRAAEGAVRACFSSAGQLCVSIERLLVADEVYEEFVERFVARTAAMTLAVGLTWDSELGSLISEDHLGVVASHVDDAVARGARVLTGGRARPDLGPFVFEPTVLEGVTPAMVCHDHETFGPVVALTRFDDEADAVALANASEYGLNAAVYSRDTRRARVLARRIHCGSVNINEGFGATFGSIDAPMGGMRHSGLGRRQGAEGIHRFTEAQSVATQRLLRFGPVLGLSARTYSAAMTEGLRLLKAMGRP